MPKARKSKISVAETPYSHCISRCVRRAFSCGQDSYTGASYEAFMVSSFDDNSPLNYKNKKALMSFNSRGFYFLSSLHTEKFTF